MRPLPQVVATIGKLEANRDSLEKVQRVCCGCCSKVCSHCWQAHLIVLQKAYAAALDAAQTQINLLIRHEDQATIGI